MEVYKGRKVIFNFICKLKVKEIIALTLSDMPAVLYYFLKYFSFSFTTHPA
jgi:hypothetical protein